MYRFVFLFSVFFFLAFEFAYSTEVIVKSDNGQPILTGYAERYSWEESKILKPAGPCIVKKIQIYFVGNTPNLDTIFITGDPSEGVVPPTLWVLHYNMLTSPIVFNYNGTPGWYEFKVPDIYLGGLDRIVVQHRVKSGGPWFAIDNDGLSTPVSSFLLNPFENNPLGFPGNYYASNSDFLVRLVVEYIYPKDSSSANPPVPTLFDVTEKVGLIDQNGKFIQHSDVSVVDWNNDFLDDIAIGRNFFQNTHLGIFQNVTSKLKINAGMTSWGDFDNDGKIDCYALLNGSYDENLKMVFSKDRVYRNLGNEEFIELNPKNLFKQPYPNPSVDFKLTVPNQQDSIPNPYSCITPLWSDFNNDGRLDLYLANNRVGLNVSGSYVERYFPDQIWLQDGDGKFRNVTKSCGLDKYELFSSDSRALGYYDCYGANACDYNLDGKIDIFVANYRLARDLLLQNGGSATFTNVGDSVGVQGIPTAVPNYFGHGMGCEWGDFNNDGYPDLAVGNLSHPDLRGIYSNPSLIFQNQGPPHFKFKEVGSQMGLKFFEMNAGICWGDFDLDGYLDLWHGQISYRAEGTENEPKRPARLYFNSGPPNFRLIDKTWETGAIIHGPWSAVRIDFDNDGDLDLLVASSHEGVRLFRNDLERKGNWVGFRLKGSPENNVNMDCYGTKLFVYSKSNIFYRELMGSISGTRCSQNSNLLHFGIGNAEIIDSIKVVYPNGFVKTYQKILPNNYYLIQYNLPLTKLKLPTPQPFYPRNHQIGLPTQTELKWYSVPEAIAYQIEVAESYDFNNPRRFSANQSSFLIDELVKGKDYFWRVKAISQTDSSFWSQPFAFMVGIPTPQAISLISPKNDSKKLNLTPRFVWSKPIFPKNLFVDYSFELQIALDSSFANIVFQKKNIADTFFIISPEILKPGNTYFWRARAVNSDGEGLWPKPFTFTTNSLPRKVTLLSPANNETEVPLKPTFRWTAVEDAEEYVFQLSLSHSFDTLISERITQSGLYKHLSSLTANTQYYWRVRARNNVGEGDWSETWTFRTLTASSVEEVNQILVYYEHKSNKIIIENPETSEVNISIHNVVGETIYTTKSSEKRLEIDFSLQPKGPYFLRVISLHNSRGILLIKFY
ncbi:MAG: FG-GAP-like repeat-containing protein [Ignavibacteria bacterium]|nr:FG-GAP-like repeat-containing protein [Ignavibacteria bacterium]